MAASNVHVRTYASVQAYQADLPSMAGAGWSPIAQTETSAGMNTNWAALAIVSGIVAVVFLPILLIGTVLLLILAAVSGEKRLVVTYRHE